MRPTIQSPLALALLCLPLAASQGGPGGGGGPQILPPPVAPGGNPVTEEKRILGKLLFWEEQLSSSNDVACGTCHKPDAGGADPRTATNPGANGSFGGDDDVTGSGALHPKAYEWSGARTDMPSVERCFYIDQAQLPCVGNVNPCDGTCWRQRSARVEPFH